MKKYGYISLFALLMTAFALPAQTNMIGGENIVQHKQLKWNRISSESFEVNYHQGDPVMASLTARYAEEALWEVCRLLDFKNRARYAFYLFTSPVDMVHSNMFPRRNDKEGGITPIRTNTTPIAFPGNYQDLQKRVRSEVTRMVMEDYYFGGGIQASIQNTVLLHLPKWYSEGFSSYVGEGWDFRDELWLTSLENANLLDFALEGDNYVNHIARKSIWYFIVSTYGQEKLSEIFYMTRLTRSVEDGIVHVLGITLKTLTERWREFVLQRITENGTFREKLEDNASSLRLNKDDRLVSFALSPVGGKAALQVENEGRFKVLIYDFKTNEMIESPIEGGFRTDQLEGIEPDFPMEWSPDGTVLLTTTWQKGDVVFAMYNTADGELSYIPFRPRLERIFQMKWSHDGKRIVCSGLRTGQIDLFYFSPGGSGFVQLTNDLYDDLNPVWSADDQRIYYASTRDNDTIKADDIRFDVYRNHFDIWEYNVSEGSLRRVTNSPVSDEFPVSVASSFEIMVLHNESGVYNLQKRNVFVGDTAVQSNVSQGLYRVGISDSIVAFTAPVRGRLQLYHAPKEEFLRESVVTLTYLRQRINKNWFLAERSKALKQKLDSLKKDQQKQQEAEKNKDKVKSDTTKPKDNKVKFYVFDEEDSEKRLTKRRFLKNRGKKLRRTKPAKPDFHTMKVKGPSSAKAKWTADRVTTQFRYDPVFKLNMSFEARLRDQQGNHMFTAGFRPFWDLKSSDTWLRYHNFKHKLDYYVGATRSSRFLNRFEFAVRYNATRVDAGVAYPLNRFLSVGGNVHANLIDRNNLEILIPRDIDGTDLFAGAAVNMTYDHRKRSRNHTMSGAYARFDVENVYGVSAGGNTFTTARADLRKYVPMKKVVLATRLAGAWSTGDGAQSYFMGGTDEWLFSHFANAQDLPIQDPNIAAFHYMEFVTPVHGFQFNGRNGTKFMVANAELRIPISRMFQRHLNSNPLYNIELIPFFDIGTTWREGNPFSQRNPIDTETINSYPLNITIQTLKSPFVMGFGAGTRLQLLGYSMRFDLGWGVEDFTVLNPRVHLSLGKNF